jgi:alanyl-tRNA synthetase
MVARFDVADNTKALLAGLNALKDASRSGLLYSFDLASSRIHYQSIVCPAHSTKFSALDLAKTFGDSLGGKSGGKEAAAMGSAPIPTEPLDIDEITSRFSKL